MSALKHPRRQTLLLRTMLFLATPLLISATQAQTFDVSVDIPTLQVAEYHRPYIATWIARPDNSVARNLSVWYDTELADQEGTKWLKDIRQWWRRTGRTLDMPADGISGATRPQGQHTVSYANKVADLEPGEYVLLVEAVREVGGREMLEIPFNWPPSGDEALTVKGEHELGQVSLTLSP